MPFGSLPLNDGCKIPQVGFGTGSVHKFEDVHDYVELAIDTGFHHFDTAQFYRNEESVGKAIRDCRLSRSNIFLATKFGSRNPDDSALEALKESLKKLGVDYVDLYLIHFPHGLDVPAVWREMEEAHERGLARSIGVSNFTVYDLRKLEGAKIKPVVNQIMLHPYNLAEQEPVLAYAAKNDIVIEAFSSLTPITTLPGGPVDPVLKKLANRRKATPAQIIFLWIMAKRAVIITTSSKRERMEEYLRTADLSRLTPDEVAEIDAVGAPV